MGNSAKFIIFSAFFLAGFPNIISIYQRFKAHPGSHYSHYFVALY